ncbi:MAG TPA: CHAT domain-containing protein [Longimicrobium sp.]|nr:CHAT domain-containing protein [Longimicrobium sp.]
MTRARRVFIPLLATAAALACGRPHGPGGDALQVLSAAGLARPFAARLSITTTYRPCGQAAPGVPPQAVCGTPSEPPATVLAAAERASTTAGAGADPGSMHAAALMDLLWGREGGNSLERSLSLLQSAARLSDRPAPALADLSAARLLRAERNGSPRDLLEAYEAAATALEHEPGLAPALFNRALALDRLGLADEAARAWDECARATPRSPWAAEARARAGTAGHTPLPRPPETPAGAEAYARADPQAALLAGLDRWLAAWGRLRGAGDSAGAAASLEMAGALGTALERRGRDASLAEAVREVRARHAGPRRLDALARAHAAYGAARERYDAGDYLGAGPEFERLAADTAASAPLRAWARLFRGATRVYAGHREEGEHDLRAVAAAADPRRTPALAGRARWSVGTTLLRAGRYQAALAEYRAAQALLERAGEREHLGAVRQLEGEALFRLGDTDGGYRALGSAARTLRPYPGSVWLHNLLWLLADAANADGLSRAALRLQDADVAVARLNGRPVYLAEARLARAESRARAGQGAGAAADLEAAAREVAAMPPGPAAWFRARLSVARASAAARTDPARASAALDTAVAFFAPGATIHLRRALVARADARLALGDVDGAAADLERATARFVELGDGVAGAAGRAALLEAARAVFDRMVMLRVRQGRPDAALQALERGRASLASGPRAGSTPPPRPGAVVAYALVGDTLLTWVVSRRGVRMARATVDRHALRTAVERARAALEAGSGEAAAGALAELYDRLVRPVQAELGAEGATVTVVPDGEVAAVPFAALRDTARRRYLVETHAVRFAPSLRDAARGATGPVPRPRALVVADPAFDPGAWPRLRRLPGAAAEALQVAALYPDAVVLDGVRATREAFARAVPRAPVVHYAGHALFDDARPGASALVLAAPPGGGTASLAAAELARLRWTGVRLVVLSACRTVRAGGAGGFDGVAGALLGAGAGGVVGSTGQVDDATTRALMTAFHRAWRQGGDGPGALREAQLALLRSADPGLRSPAAWGTFRYAGF